MQFNTAVDVPLIVKNMWLGPKFNGVTFMSTDQEMNFTMYISTTMIRPAISGNYTCEVMINSSSQFIVGNEIASGYLEIIVGKKL